MQIRTKTLMTQGTLSLLLKRIEIVKGTYITQLAGLHYMPPHHMASLHHLSHGNIMAWINYRYSKKFRKGVPEKAFQVNEAICPLI